MSYRIELSKRAERVLENLPARVQSRLIQGIDGLADDPRPRGVEKLRGEQNAYRIRVGDYRILYEVHDQVLLILILRAGHRREVYRRK